MKRRKALKQIGWGLSGSIFLPSLLEACAPNDPGPEINYNGSVAIIGAGAAGLYVADILHSKGVNVTIFEARDQLGGRVCSLRNQSATQYPNKNILSSDFPIELGAQVITGSNSILGQIYKNYLLTTAEIEPTFNEFILDSTAKSDSGWAADADYLAAKNFKNALKTYAGNSQTVQTEAQAVVGQRGLGMLNGLIGNLHGSSNDKIGIGALAQDEVLTPTDGKILVLRSNPIQDVLISRFSAIQTLVKTNTPITSVNYGGDLVTLTAKDGTSFEFNKVIVTVPISIIKSGGIAFSPGLPSTYTNSLSKIGFGASLRVFIEFKKNFWGISTGFIYGSNNFPEYFNVGVGTGFNQSLSVTVNGDKAAQYSALGELGAVNAIIADLDLIYNGQATKFVRKDVNNDKMIYVIEDWTTREYIKGGYSYPLAGATNNDRKAIATPVGEKLFFAGEATDISGQAGMVNGALASAERCAEEVVKSILAPA
ncbi:FAD-dependent oxidoreductase [soil metagenome]